MHIWSDGLRQIKLINTWYEDDYQVFIDEWISASEGKMQ